MKKITILLIFLSSFSFAQVGIGNANPKSTLDITATSPTGTSTNVDGITIPTVTRERAQSMAATNIPVSTMIYISEATSGTATGKTANVTSAGIYFWDGSLWTSIKTTVKAGTILNTVMTNITGVDVTVSGTTYTNIATTSYTPVSSNSTIIVEFNTKYDISGNGDDSFSSQIQIGSTQLTYNTQKFVDGSGSSSGDGTRSGTLFPLMGGYTNIALTALTINIQAKRDSANDSIVFKRDASTWIKITEIAR
jgi:hypothetical protein